MADVLSDLKNWSATASSNLPSGSATIGTGLDDNLRQIQATVVQDLSTVGADIASATTTDIGAIAGLFHTITGTATITSFGTVRSGLWKILTFSGALTITYNATSMITPGSVSMSITAKDSIIAESLGSGNWKIHPFNSMSTLLGSATPKIPTITATVGSSALTIDMTAQYLDFRSATLTSGAITTLYCDPTALVVSAGSTLGTTSAVESKLAVAVINNAGTAELAVANMVGLTIDESVLISTTAEGGAGAADSTATWYSTTARTNVAFRIIGYIKSTQATAGTWATAPSNISGEIKTPGNGRLIGMTTITSTNATWSPDPRTKTIVATVVGGGSGGTGAQGSSGYYSGQAGYAGAVNTAQSTSVSGTYAATIGPGGAAGGIYSASSSAGTDSSFIGTGISVTAAGGLAAVPQQHDYGNSALSYGGHGETGFNGVGGAGGAGDAVGGDAGANSGAGGGAGASSGVTERLGGAGGSGVIFVWEYS